MNLNASGPFDVRMTPEAAPTPETAFPPRNRLDKHYHGPLQAHGEGLMLAFMSETAGSAGYVALERVHGTLQGREGSFVLQHHGLMDRGVPQLAITVVPGSGTGALAGLAGTMAIRIEGGHHFYEFTATLP